MLEDYSLVCEAAERVGTSGGTLAVSGLEVARTGEGGYKVRQDGLLVFRCLAGRPAEVYTLGEWVARLAHAGGTAAA